MDAIKKLEEDREEAREEYRDLLSDYITDATRKLAEIGEKAPSASLISGGQHGRYATHVEAPAKPSESAAMTAPQAPLTIDGSDAYDSKPAPVVEPVAPAAAAGATVAAAPIAAGIEKDFSGYGDAADDFEIDDLD